MPPLKDRLQDLRPSRLGQQCKFRHRILGILSSAFGPDPDQDNLLQSQLAILDLGDVFEFGTEPGYSTQGMTLGEFLGAKGQRLWVCLVVVADGDVYSRHE